MNSRGGVKRVCPEDLLTVAKICLDLLMRPDKSCCPGRVTVAPRLCQGWMNHRKEEERKRGSKREKMVKNGLLSLDVLYCRLAPSAALCGRRVCYLSSSSRSSG